LHALTAFFARLACNCTPWLNTQLLAEASAWTELDDEEAISFLEKRYQVSIAAMTNRL